MYKLSYKEHKELYSLSCNNLNGKESEKEYIITDTYKTEPLAVCWKHCKSTLLQ